MLLAYENSIINLLSSIYPNHHWLPWKFVRIPNGFWENKGNQLEYMNWLKEQLNIKDIEDWYNVSVDVIIFI